MIIYSKELLFQPYTPNSLIAEYTVAGTYSLEIKGPGTFEVEAISGGGGGTCFDGILIGARAIWFYKQGATGAYYRGLFYLPNGIYTINVGGGGYGGANSANGSGSYTTIDGILSMSGGTSYGMYANDPGGTLEFISNEVERIAYNAGYGSIMSGTSNYYENRGIQYAPVPSELAGFGYGGAAYGPYAGCGQYGGVGYLKITYKGV